MIGDACTFYFFFSVVETFFYLVFMKWNKLQNLLSLYVDMQKLRDIALNSVDSFSIGNLQLRCRYYYVGSQVLFFLSGLWKSTRDISGVIRICHTEGEIILEYFW